MATAILEDDSEARVYCQEIDDKTPDNGPVARSGRRVVSQWRCVQCVGGVYGVLVVCLAC